MPDKDVLDALGDSCVNIPLGIDERVEVVICRFGGRRADDEGGRRFGRAGEPLPAISLVGDVLGERH